MTVILTIGFIMQSNDLIDTAEHLIQSSINGVSSLISFQTGEGSFSSDKTLPELLSLSQLDVEQEIAIANSITEATITLINNHENATTRGYLFNMLKEEYISSIEQGKPAIIPFMQYMATLYGISETQNLPDEKGIGGYLSTVFSLALAYTKSLAAKQGLFLPEILNNEIRNGVTFDLFKPTQWDKHLYTGNASGILYAVYDDKLIDGATKAIRTELSAEQVNYLYYYFAYISYQISFGSFIAMELVENLTGLNFGFEQNNRLIKSIKAD